MKIKYAIAHKILTVEKCVRKSFYTERCSEFAAWFPGINPLTPELNPTAQRCLTRIFTGDFAS
jgi:hypothetical protein